MHKNKNSRSRFYTTEKGSNNVETLKSSSLETLQKFRHENLNAFVGDQIKDASGLKKEQEKLTNSFKNLKGEVNKIKAGNVELLAIFVALFTFVSVQFQAIINADNAIVPTISSMTMWGLIAITSFIVMVSSFNEKLKLIVATIVLLVSMLLLYQTNQAYQSYLLARSECDVSYDKYISSDKTDERALLIKKIKDICGK